MLFGAASTTCDGSASAAAFTVRAFRCFTGARGATMRPACSFPSRFRFRRACGSPLSPMHCSAAPGPVSTPALANCPAPFRRIDVEGFLALARQRKCTSVCLPSNRLQIDVSPDRIRLAPCFAPPGFLLDGKAAFGFFHAMMPRYLTLLYQRSMGDHKTARRARVYQEVVLPCLRSIAKRARLPRRYRLASSQIRSEMPVLISARSSFQSFRRRQRRRKPHQTSGQQR